MSQPVKPPIRKAKQILSVTNVKTSEAWSWDAAVKAIKREAKIIDQKTTGWNAGLHSGMNSFIKNAKEIHWPWGTKAGQPANRGFSNLTSPSVEVRFDKNANNPINPKLNSYFKTIMEKASKVGISTINISSTTNHPSNSKKSAHSIANGARALDINYINGIHVSAQNPFTNVLQNIIQITPGWRENYGPIIIQKMNNGAPIQAPWAREIPGGHYDHIHISVPEDIIVTKKIK